METQPWRPNVGIAELGKDNVELLGVPRHTVLVKFTPHAGDEMLRDGNWVADWTPAEAVAG